MKPLFRSIQAGFLLAGLTGGLSAQTLTNLGLTAPTPGENDIYQPSTQGNTAWPNKPDNINYYTDNNPPVGQTFTTGTNALNRATVAIKTGGLDSRGGYGTPATTPTYYLRIYSISNTTATLLISSSAANPGFTDGRFFARLGIQTYGSRRVAGLRREAGRLRQERRVQQPRHLGGAGRRRPAHPDGPRQAPAGRVRPGRVVARWGPAPPPPRPAGAGRGPPAGWAPAGPAPPGRAGRCRARTGAARPR